MKNVGKNLFAALAAFSLIGGFSVPAYSASKSKKAKNVQNSVTEATDLTFVSDSESEKSAGIADEPVVKDENFRAKTVDNTVGKVRFLAKGAF